MCEGQAGHLSSSAPCHYGIPSSWETEDVIVMTRG